MSKLVHVNKIEMIRCEDLISLKIISDTSCRFQNNPFFVNLNIHDLVGISIEDSLENNQKVYNTVATFQCCCKQPLTDRRLAFRLTSIDGKRYLIGTNNRPYPIIKEKNTFPEKPTDSTLKNVSVTWKALYPMLLIVD